MIKIVIKTAKFLMLLLAFVIISSFQIVNDNNYCWWYENHRTNNNVYAIRGDACGDEYSLRILYTNPYSFSVNIAMYFQLPNGQYTQNSPYIMTLRPGETANRYLCRSNGYYIVLVSMAGTNCDFPYF